jgi:hypothetical protein
VSTNTAVARDAALDDRRLVTALASKAARMGSNDAELSTFARH